MDPKSKRFQDLLTRMRLGQPVDPGEMEAIFNQRPYTQPQTDSNLALPGLARKIAFFQMQMPVPRFYIPQDFQLYSGRTLSDVVQFTRNLLHAPSGDLIITWDLNQMHCIQLSELLEDFAQSSGGCSQEICLVRKTEFEHLANQLAKEVRDSSSKAAHDHYSREFEIKYRPYIGRLEKDLRIANSENFQLRSRIVELTQQRSLEQRVIQNLRDERDNSIKQFESTQSAQFADDEMPSHSNLPDNHGHHQKDHLSVVRGCHSEATNVELTNSTVKTLSAESSFCQSPESCHSSGRGKRPFAENSMASPYREISSSIGYLTKSNGPEQNYALPVQGLPLFENIPTNSLYKIISVEGGGIPQKPRPYISALPNINQSSYRSMRGVPRGSISSCNILPEAKLGNSSIINNHNVPLMGESKEYSQEDMLSMSSSVSPEKLAMASAKNLSLEKEIQLNLDQSDFENNPIARETSQGKSVDTRGQSTTHNSVTFCSPTAKSQSLGKIVGQDEVGPIYDYTELMVGMRGGAGTADELEGSNWSGSNKRPMENAGFNQRMQKLMEDDDEVDYSTPVVFNGVPIATPSQAEISHKSEVTSAFSNAIRSRNGTSYGGNRNRGSGYGRQRGGSQRRDFAPAFDDVDRPNQNDTFVGYDYFKPLSNKDSLADTSSESHTMAQSSSVISESDSYCSPLQMTFGSVFNPAPVASSLNSTVNSSTHVHDSTPLLPGSGPSIDPLVESQALRNDELHLAQKSTTEFEKANSQYISRNTGRIIQYIGGKEVIYEPKSDKRLRNIDDEGNYLGGEHNKPKKRQLRGVKEQIKERHRQLLEKSKDYRYFCSLTREDRAWLWEQRYAPLKYWQGKPGAAAEDQIEIDQVPEQYRKTYKNYLLRQSKTLTSSGLSSNVFQHSESGSSTYPYSSSRFARSYTGSIHGFEAGSNYGFADENHGNGEEESIDLQTALFDLDDNTNNPKRPAPSIISSSLSTLGRPFALQVSIRSDEEVLRMLHDIFSSQDRFPAPGSTASRSYPTPGSITSRRTRSIRSKSNLSSDHPSYPSCGWSPFQSTTGYSDGEAESIFHGGYHGPELQYPEDVEIRATVTQASLKDHIRHAFQQSKENPRVILVTLHPGPVFTPGALTKRLFGGIIQDIQLHECFRAAVVVFLYPAEAAAFVTHINNIKRHGLHQEVASLQIVADWYKGDRAESVVKGQQRIFKHAIFHGATRTLRLQNLNLDLARDAIFTELGIRLGKLLASVILVTPKQRYKQAQDGRQAIVEFISIKDAIESRQALLNGEIQGYEDCEPEFTADPAMTSENYQEKSYCDCITCLDVRAGDA